MRPARIETYGDHRMAMSFALVGLGTPGIEIADPEVVAAQRLQDEVGRTLPGARLAVDANAWVEATDGWLSRLFEIQGETTVLNRELVSAQTITTDTKMTLAELQRERNLVQLDTEPLAEVGEAAELVELADAALDDPAVLRVIQLPFLAAAHQQHPVGERPRHVIQHQRLARLAVHVAAADLAAARDTTLPDLLGPDLRLLICGINPSLWAAATQAHFARPGNRFWPALHDGGFTDRRLHPSEDRLLPAYGCGVTNLVDAATATAAEVPRDALVRGGWLLAEKVTRYAPRWLAVLGITAYRTAFDRPDAVLGPQPEMLGHTPLWVLPNPSGLNAHYPPPALARLFRELHVATRATGAG